MGIKKKKAIPSKAEQERIFRLVRKWQTEFYLHIIRIDVHFAECESDVDGNNQFGARCFASINAKLADSYHRATLVIYPAFFEDSHEEQEFSIVHEMAHILTQPLCALLERAQDGELITASEVLSVEERVTDMMARICLYGGSAPFVTLKLKV